ncbi:MAG TPA: peptide deformylase [Candidatus Saccharimonadales bacterium]|nr:peptide deformylase [Candidatus Saccharimonadales bacterium]
MSAKDKIIVLPNSQLRQKSQKITVLTPEIKRLIANMKAATLDWEASREHEVGVALAAIQLGQPYRVIIIRNHFDDKENHDFSVFINPEIVKLEGEIEEDYEGCLSVRDIYGKVPRHSKVRLRAVDEQGREVRVKAEGFLARVLQHEVDHTKGIMYVDHIEDQRSAFYKLTDEGKLESMAYSDVQKADIFRQ